MQIASNTDKKMEIYCKNAEIGNLPTKDVPVGSSAFVIDTGAVLIFDNDTSSWVAL